MSGDVYPLEVGLPYAMAEVSLGSARGDRPGPDLDAALAAEATARQIGCAIERNGLASASIEGISAPRSDVDVPFRQIVDAAPYGMAMVGADGKILMANTQMAADFGYSRDEMTGRPFSGLMGGLAADLASATPSADAATRATDDVAPPSSVRAVRRDGMGLRKDGTAFPVELGVRRFAWNGGVASIAAVIDISARKRTELDLREANAQLEEFAFVASHDLKSPLRGIGDLVDWLGDDLKGSLSPETRKNLERIHCRVLRMQRIIDDLLAYARGRDTSMAVASIRPADVVAEVVEMEAPPTGIDFQVVVTATPFIGARVPFETVLRNLVSNAVKHHDRERGTVFVRVSDENSYCHIEVSDDGPGIPREFHERVFKLFQTVSTSERRGSGIGLALAKRLVESHGGRIDLLSGDHARGTAFHVFWPRSGRGDVHDSDSDVSLGGD